MCPIKVYESIQDGADAYDFWLIISPRFDPIIRLLVPFPIAINYLRDVIFELDALHWCSEHRQCRHKF
jgi:hypothetical protein